MAIREDGEEEGLHEGTDTRTTSRVVSRTKRTAAATIRLRPADLVARQLHRIHETHGDKGGAFNTCQSRKV